MAEGKRSGEGRKKLAEGVWRLPSGAVELRWYAGKQDGKERTKTKTLPAGTSREEAIEARLREMRNAKAQRNRTGEETIAEFAERWTKDYPRGESTNMHNRSQVKPFVRDFGHRAPSTITWQEARLWSAGGRMAPDWTREARREVLRWDGVTEEDGLLVVPPHRGNVPAVRAMFGDLIREKGLQANPFANLGLKQSRGRSDITVLTTEQVEELVRLAHRHAGAHFGAMTEVAAWTGLRPGELYALRWSKVDLDGGVIYVHRAYQAKTRKITTTKNKQHRTVELLPPAEEALRNLRAVSYLDDRRGDEAHRDIVFRTPKGVPFYPRQHLYYWHKVRSAFYESLEDEERCSLCEAALAETGAAVHDGPHDGVPADLEFYELRHHAATSVAQLPGVTPMDVADMLGHQDGGKLAMERYFHVASTAARKRIRRGFERQQAEDRGTRQRPGRTAN